VNKKSNLWCSLIKRRGKVLRAGTRLDKRRGPPGDHCWQTIVPSMAGRGGLFPGQSNVCCSAVLTLHQKKRWGLARPPRKLTTRGDHGRRKGAARPGDPGVRGNDRKCVGPADVLQPGTVLRVPGGKRRKGKKKKGEKAEWGKHRLYGGGAGRKTKRESPGARIGRHLAGGAAGKRGKKRTE